DGVPLKYMCSSTWEMPTVESGSSKYPALTQVTIAMTGALWSSRMRTVSPLGNTRRTATDPAFPLPLGGRLSGIKTGSVPFFRSLLQDAKEAGVGAAADEAFGSARGNYDARERK